MLSKESSGSYLRTLERSNLVEEIHKELSELVVNYIKDNKIGTLQMYKILTALATDVICMTVDFIGKQQEDAKQSAPE